MPHHSDLDNINSRCSSIKGCFFKTNKTKSCIGSHALWSFFRDCFGSLLLCIWQCIDSEELSPLNTSWNSIKSYYNNQEFRVHSSASCFMQPGVAQTLQIRTPRHGRILLSSNFQQLRDQQQQLTEASHPQDMNRLPPWSSSPTSPS